MNNTIICGNLGSDPELKTFGQDGAVLKLSVAVSESVYNKTTDTREKRTEWFRCAIFGKRAEALAGILVKGEKVLIEGSMRTSSYEKDGETKYTTDLIVRELHLLGQKRDGQQPSNRVQPSPRAQGRPQGRSSGPVDPQGKDTYGDYDDDQMPF